MQIDSREGSSFRDPSGFIFLRDGEIYRQVNRIFKDDYDFFIECGLFDSLVQDGLLIPHEEVDVNLAHDDSAYKILKPERIRFVSYPYEWCFSQLKNAALTTLKIQQRALKFGMTLKDGSAYKMQFQDGRPVFIDTLSFERHEENTPWVAYRQFCRHFLASLALMSYKDVYYYKLHRVYLDGIPLEFVHSMLPLTSRFSLGMLIHIHMHSKAQRRYAEKTVDVAKYKINLASLGALIENLEKTVAKLKLGTRRTEWINYYGMMNYSSRAFESKKRIVAEFIDLADPENVLDIGANDGYFSRLASSRGVPTLACDIDPLVVEANYQKCLRDAEKFLLPLILDITNPSPDIGWENRERTAFLKRIHADTVVALAIVHHLAISNNLPLDQLALFFKEICSSLIIEFVPKSDSKTQRLLSSRKDIFVDYRQEVFEETFSRHFKIVQRRQIEESERTLYLMLKK